MMNRDLFSQAPVSKTIKQFLNHDWIQKSSLALRATITGLQLHSFHSTRRFSEGPSFLTKRRLQGGCMLTSKYSFYGTPVTYNLDEFNYLGNEEWKSGYYRWFVFCASGEANDSKGFVMMKGVVWNLTKHGNLCYMLTWRGGQQGSQTCI